MNFLTRTINVFTESYPKYHITNLHRKLLDVDVLREMIVCVCFVKRLWLVCFKMHRKRLGNLYLGNILFIIS